MPGLAAIKELTESPDPEIRQIGFRLLERGGGKFLDLFRGDKHFGSALDSLVKKGRLARENRLYTGADDPAAHRNKVHSAMRLGGVDTGNYEGGYTHYRTGRTPGEINLAPRDYEKRLDVYQGQGDPGEAQSFLARTNPEGKGFTPEDAARISSYSNVRHAVAETPRQDVEPLPPVSEDWQGTLDLYSPPEVSPGRSFDDIGPSAVRRAISAPKVESAAGLNPLAKEVLIELKKRFPRIPKETLIGEIQRAMLAKQAGNYPEDINYDFYATKPERFEEVQKQLKETGGRALNRLRLPR